ncbi:MAG: CRISPR-associated protein Cas4 [Clostridiales bacterium]|nr:CRISPR-associated protein Cas4 [Clostridiales bacterium]
MAFEEEDFLQIAGLQHFAFCRRQWALIHVENLWRDNLRTVEGELLHKNAHDDTYTERRGDTLTVRGERVFSRTLGVSGACDVLEFRLHPDGVTLPGQEGLWLPYPVEYKRGSPKEHSADELQLCCQAMCLEEMLCCPIPEGSLYYGETRRRVKVPLTEELRRTVRDDLTEMHQYASRGYTPRVKPSKACNACSLKEQCLPALLRRRSVQDYLERSCEEL